jgi:hypothetical protein
MNLPTFVFPRMVTISYLGLVAGSALVFLLAVAFLRRKRRPPLAHNVPDVSCPVVERDVYPSVSAAVSKDACGTPLLAEADFQLHCRPCNSSRSVSC